MSRGSINFNRNSGIRNNTPNFVSEFAALPGNGRPETTRGPSVRNLVHNVKQIPGDFKNFGKAVVGGFKSLTTPLKQGSGGKYGRGAGRGKALQMRMK